MDVHVNSVTLFKISQKLSINKPEIFDIFVLNFGYKVLEINILVAKAGYLK